MNRSLVILLLTGATAAFAVDQPPSRLDGSRQSAGSVDTLVQSLMKDEQVPGLGLALIHDGKVRYRKAYGLRDIAASQPLTPDTILYGASLTKATFAYFVMQLVDEGRLELDRPIATYLPKPLPDYPRYADLRDDERWRRLTFRILLSHTTGFANFRGVEPDKRLRFHHDPGTRYGYSGEGILLAQFVIEEGLHLDVAAEMQRRIFTPLGMTRSSMVWREDFANNLAQDYREDGSPYRHKRWQAAGAPGSLDTTLADWSTFLAAVVSGKGLSEKARADMIGRSVEIDSPTQFPTLQEQRTDQWKAIGLGYGIGWGVFDTPYGRAFFKEGHDEGTANYALCVAKRRGCILLMSNSVRAERIYATLVQRLLGDVGLPHAWEGYAAPR